MAKVCTCQDWWTKDPVWDPSCEIEKHADLAFEQRGWNRADVLR